MMNLPVYFGRITMPIIRFITIQAVTKYLKTLLLAISFLFLCKPAYAGVVVLDNFGDNPGALKASYYLPETINLKEKSVPIVVLLHGCAQQANELAQQSGFLGLAKQHKFVLLMPQQDLGNNIKRCFNWYSAEDFTKGKGETLSIKNMITTLKQKLASDSVYIIGLSAGGAMASGLLVNYPELFTAGAVVAGIPFPCADGLITGISCMKNGPSQTIDEFVELIEKIAPKQSKWPKLSVWTGNNDSIVNPLNASMLAQQWAKLSKITASPISNQQSGYSVTRWKNANEETQVEFIEVMNRDHGIMVNPNIENGGEASDYLLAAPLSTAKQLVEFWNLK